MSEYSREDKTPINVKEIMTPAIRLRISTTLYLMFHNKYHVIRHKLILLTVMRVIFIVRNAPSPKEEKYFCQREKKYKIPSQVSNS